MGLNAAVQALKKAEPLKDKIQRCKDLLNDNDAWLCQQQLQKIYQQVLILDLEYALDKKVEQELWNLGFKNCIALLQGQAKDHKNPKRTESQAMLSWYLEAASGFYLTLLQEICTAFDLDLPFRRKGYIYGCISPWKAVEKLSTPHKSSCFYACQYCLVHLGDIARYRNQNRQAELFYRHAVSLSPSSGQPYNQLALLEASRGDKLGTVFHYVRSVAVKHPFPVATANLAKILSSALNDNLINIHEKSKLNSQEYIIVFLKLHGILHNLEDLYLSKSYVKSLSETLTALVATESFSSWRLIQMFVINLYSLYHMVGNTFESSIDFMKVDQLSSDERIARNCILDLIAASLSALLLPVYTVKNSYVDYFALPTIKLLLEWIRQQPMILEDVAFSSRLQIWPSLCVLLNGLQNSIIDFKAENLVKTPLPEDRDLQGFLPLEKTFDSLRFCNNDLEGDLISINKLRAVRIINLGIHLAHCNVNGRTLLNVVNVEDNRLQFTCLSDVSGPSNELMKELEELSLNKERQVIFTAASPVPSESASSKGSSEAEVVEQLSFEKKVGILKPSLERNKDTNCQVEISSLTSTRKIRQNIAMQAIMRRVENEQKQVTFQNISPIVVDDGSTDSKKKQPQQKEMEYTMKYNNQSLANDINTTQAINSQLIRGESVKPQSSEVHAFQNSTRNQFPSPPVYTDQGINVQDRPFDKPFGMNIVPPIPQFSHHQIPQNIHQLAPSITKPLPSSLPHPLIMNTQGIPNQHSFLEKNSSNQSNHPITIPIDFPKVIGTGFNASYFKPMDQIEPNGRYSSARQLNENSYEVESNFPNYPSDFNPWKNTQPPPQPPPVSWWGVVSKDRLEIEGYQNWANPPIAPIRTSESNYYDNAIIDKQQYYGVEEAPRSCEVNTKINNTNTYSLFSGNTWGNPVQAGNLAQNQPKPGLTQQSLWSGPGPSPLERLLEQQKSLREGGT